MNEKTRKVLEKKKADDKETTIDRGIVIVAPNETMSSVKIEETAGGTRVKVKVYSNNLAEAQAEAIRVYDELRKMYKDDGN